MVVLRPPGTLWGCPGGQGQSLPQVQRRRRMQQMVVLLALGLLSLMLLAARPVTHCSRRLVCIQMSKACCSWSANDRGSKEGAGKLLSDHELGIETSCSHNPRCLL